MATIPEKPQTNLEQYLNRIATGDGEYPAKPRTNVEQYLNYIIENGTGGGELVTELPAEGKEGKLYVLVDDATAPTKAYGVYTYAGGQYIVIAQPIDQSVQKVTTLPTEGQEGVLYYLETSADTYDLYRWINNEWIKVDSDIILYSQEGSNVDGAMTQKAVTDALNDKQNVLTAGDSIDITNDIISATNTGKAKILTTADYNWPVNNPTSVALWLLPEGFYIKPSGSSITVWISAGRSLGAGVIAMVAGTGTSGFASQHIHVFDYADNNGPCMATTYNVEPSSGGLFGSFPWQWSKANNLTTTTANLALDARQGRVLKNLIDSIAIRGAGAPTASTAGQVGTLYENTTNGALYICTTVSGSTYTWEKVALYRDLPTTLTDEQYEALWSTPNALNNYLETIVSGQGV